MGRNREQGPKQLVKALDNPRFQRVFVTKGDSRLPYLLSMDRYDEHVAGFERRGWVVEKAQS